MSMRFEEKNFDLTWFISIYMFCLNSCFTYKKNKVNIFYNIKTSFQPGRQAYSK